MIILITVIAYFSAIFFISRATSQRATNKSFYHGDRRSPWYLVAFGMIGASLSGISFVSVPGMVVHSDMTYLQTCMGFIFGYIFVALVLLPVYYRQNSPTIYSYLGNRIGRRSYLTGASFFLLSKITGAALRFYVVCAILYRFVVTPLLHRDHPALFAATAVVMVAVIWLYTRRGGIKTLVWTDTLQTFCLFAAIIAIIINVTDTLQFSLGEAVSAIAHDSHSRVFVWDDWMSRQNFWKQFISGIFIVIVMTGLDQDMMQKNLTCRSLREAQKDMCTYGMAFVPANLLLMALGILLLMLANSNGMTLPPSTDDIMPMFAATGYLGSTVTVLFTIGIVAAAMSSADSAMTALTTSFCVDVMQRPDDERLRRHIHLGMAAAFVAFILLFRTLNSTSVIDAVYILCSYTYGPLLGLFAYAMLAGKKGKDAVTETCADKTTAQRTSGADSAVPYIAVISPMACYALDLLAQHLWGYKFGYELLMLNGLITFGGIMLCRRHIKPKQKKKTN